MQKMANKDHETVFVLKQNMAGVHSSHIVLYIPYMYVVDSRNQSLYAPILSINV